LSTFRKQSLVKFGLLAHIWPKISEFLDLQDDRNIAENRSISMKFERVSIAAISFGQEVKNTYRNSLLATKAKWILKLTFSGKKITKSGNGRGFQP